MYPQGVPQYKATLIKMLTKGVVVGQLQKLTGRKGPLKASS